MFVLIYWLREFLLSVVTNLLELRCELKQPLLLYSKSVLVDLENKENVENARKYFANVIIVNLEKCHFSYVIILY